MTPEEVNQKIDAVLARCDGKATPRICEKMQTEAGIRYIKERIRHLIVVDKMPSISACLPHIEQELDGL